MKRFGMFKGWLWAAGLGLLLGLLGMALPASAARPDEANLSTQIVRSSVSFTLPADTCGELPPGVSLSGTGTNYAVITTKSKPDGSKLVVVSATVVGTATDSNGGTYQFIYANQDRNQIPKNSGPIKVNMTDVFTLLGDTGTYDYTVAFNWTWTYTPPEGEWPPVHNWNQVVTQGDPLHCDPL